MRRSARPCSGDRACLAESLLAGCWTEFFGLRVALAINLITATGIFLLARASSFPLGWLAAALIGVGAGGEAAITPYLLTRYVAGLFDALRSHLDVLRRRAIGPVILGRAFDLAGSYAALLTMLAAALGFVATINLLLPRYSDSSATEIR
jgi:hypothetical protein